MSLVAVPLGMNAKLYFCAAGIGGTPTWTEVANATNVTLNVTKGESDATTRANNGWKAVATTLKEASVEWEMVWNKADAGFTAMQQAFFNNTLLGMAVMDGDIAVAGNQGLWADCNITNFSREEPLAEVIKAKVTAKPGYSTNAPQWKTIAGS